MTKTEAKDILIERLDFKVVDAVTNSGRYYEDEHPIVTLDNIKDCQPTKNIEDVDFNAYLLGLKTAVSYQLLSDVFDTDYIKGNLFTDYPSLFDNCLSVLMTIKVIEIAISSERANRTKSITKSIAQQIHFDLNGNYGQDSNPNFPRAFGIAHKYKECLRELRNKLNTQRKFVSITTGMRKAVFNESYYYNPDSGSDLELTIDNGFVLLG